MTYNAIILDYIGTLVQPSTYSLDASRMKLHSALWEAGLETDVKMFMESYKTAHEKYRKIRYEKLKEVTNAVWVSEALCKSGCKVSANDPRLKTGLNVFFQDFINTLLLQPYANKLLTTASSNVKLGLITNFTYAPAIYASLRQLGINRYFNTIVISDSIGWRKPHIRIFEEALKRLQLTASRAVFVGDSPSEDIKGAKAAGMKTVLVSSQFYSAADLIKCGARPDLSVATLKEVDQKIWDLLN